MFQDSPINNPCSGECLTIKVLGWFISLQVITSLDFSLVSFMMQNIDCELEPPVQLDSGLRSQGERKGISLLPDAGAAWELF